MTVSELNDLLLKHHESINQKVNFVVDNAPQKLHEEIMLSRQMQQPPPQYVQAPPQVPIQYVQKVEVSAEPVKIESPPK